MDMNILHNKKLKDKKYNLNIKLILLYKKIFLLRLQLFLGKLKKTHLLKTYKKKIASIKTFLHLHK